MNSLWERTAISHEPLSIVVLAEHASADSLKLTLSELQKELNQLKRNEFEVLIPVESGMEETFQSALVGCGKARLVADDKVSQGVGSALRVGIEQSKHPLLFVLPVGFPASSLELCLKEIDQVDVVCGVRQSKQAGWQRRQFFSKAYQLFGLWMQDPECPVKLFRRKIFKQMPIQSQGIFVFVEILAKANFQSRLMTEVVIEGPEFVASEVKKDFWTVLNNPDFGKNVEKVVEVQTKSIIKTQAPEARP
ncbi:MAG: hypothetical protein JNJ77_13105 [Planctomycetia bacterium]|nr:hypothetical protein [Planctomycetia bacterium]